MNWGAIGAISEALGALAVFITLGYLAIQVRHARYEVRRSQSQSRGETIRTLLLARATDARLAKLSFEAETLLGGANIPPVVETLVQAGMKAADVWSLWHEQVAYFTYFQQVALHVEDLGPGDRKSFEGHMRYEYGSSRLGRLFYETFVRQAAHPDVLRYIEGVLAQTP